MNKFECALFLDIGRKYWQKEKLFRLIDEMKSLAFNTLILHFSEDVGMRIESRKFPWLAGSDDTLVTQKYTIADPDEGKYLTQEEICQIADYASKASIKILPSFDSPGHMNCIVKKFNEHYNDDIGNYYHYQDKTAVVQGSGLETANCYSRGIDITNSRAVEFTHELLKEYGELFYSLGSDSFDMGGDELLGWGASVDSSVSKWKQLDHWRDYAIKYTGKDDAVAYDAFVLYMNECSHLLHSLGYKSTRMWNDDAYRTSDTAWNKAVRLDSDIEIEYWTDSANSSRNDVFTYINSGHNIYNYINTYSYFVLTKGARAGESYPKVTPKNIISEWNPFILSDKDDLRNIPSDSEKLKGCALCVWCDDPTLMTCDEITESLSPIMKAYSAKAEPFVG